MWHPNTLICSYLHLPDEPFVLFLPGRDLPEFTGSNVNNMAILLYRQYNDGFTVKKNDNGPCQAGNDGLGALLADQPITSLKSGSKFFSRQYV
jgi:hypothetical protein